MSNNKKAIEKANDIICYKTDYINNIIDYDILWLRENRCEDNIELLNEAIEILESIKLTINDNQNANKLQ